MRRRWTCAARPSAAPPPSRPSSYLHIRVHGLFSSATLQASLAAWRSLCATSEAAFSKAPSSLHLPRRTCLAAPASSHFAPPPRHPFRQVYSALRVDERLVTRGVFSFHSLLEAPLTPASTAPHPLAGESFYNPRLPSVLEDLEAGRRSSGRAETLKLTLCGEAAPRRRAEYNTNVNLMMIVHTMALSPQAGGLLQESDGARCVFLEGYTNRDGEPLPVIVQKSDGGFMYSTTDLAAIRQRVADEEARRVLYVTDAGQALHFQQVFEIARRAGFAPDSVARPPPFSPPSPRHPTSPAPGRGCTARDRPPAGLAFTNPDPNPDPNP